MWKERIILIVVSLAIAAALYSLPTVVVDNKNSNSGGRSGDMSVSVNESIDRGSIGSTQLSAIQTLRDSINLIQDNEKSLIFADSLANLYSKLSVFDSAAHFADLAASINNTIDSHIKAGNYYYQAFNFASNQELAEEFAEKTRYHLNYVLEQSNNQGSQEQVLEAKTKIALTYISSANPMQGIFMLREVLETDPDHELALLNMGLLSIKSGQYDKAQLRFKKLVEVNPDHLDGHFYLGISYLETGQDNLAKEQFEIAKSLNPPAEVEQAIDQYLKELI